MHTLKKISFYFTLTFLLLATVQCGQKGTSACAPNYEGNGLSILITHLPGSTNQFEITICDANRTNNRDISVYGVYSQSDIPSMSLSTRVRAPHVEDSSRPLDSFYVTFNSDDNYFVIFEDDINGNFSKNVELVRGELY